MSATQFSSQMLKESKKGNFCRKACLTQQHLFVAFDNKKIAFECSINDVGNTIFFSNAERVEKKVTFVGEHA